MIYKPEVGMPAVMRAIASDDKRRWPCTVVSHAKRSENRTWVCVVINGGAEKRYFCSMGVSHFYEVETTPSGATVVVEGSPWALELGAAQ